MGIALIFPEFCSRSPDLSKVFLIVPLVLIEGKGQILHCLIGCRKVIDAINYYEISALHKEVDENFKVILSDILNAVIGEGIIAANDLVIDNKSPINYIKIRNKINEEKLDT